MYINEVFCKNIHVAHVDNRRIQREGNTQPSDPKILGNTQPSDLNISGKTQPSDPNILGMTQPSNPKILDNSQPSDSKILGAIVYSSSVAMVEELPHPSVNNASFHECNSSLKPKHAALRRRIRTKKRRWWMRASYR